MAARGLSSLGTASAPRRTAADNGWPRGEPQAECRISTAPIPSTPPRPPACRGCAPSRCPKTLRGTARTTRRAVMTNTIPDTVVPRFSTIDDPTFGHRLPSMYLAASPAAALLETVFHEVHWPGTTRSRWSCCSVNFATPRHGVAALRPGCVLPLRRTRPVTRRRGRREPRRSHRARRMSGGRAKLSATLETRVPIMGPALASQPVGAGSGRRGVAARRRDRCTVRDRCGHRRPRQGRDGAPARSRRRSPRER